MWQESRFYPINSEDFERFQPGNFESNSFDLFFPGDAESLFFKQEEEGSLFKTDLILKDPLLASLNDSEEEIVSTPPPSSPQPHSFLQTHIPPPALYSEPYSLSIPQQCPSQSNLVIKSEETLNHTGFSPSPSPLLSQGYSSQCDYALPSYVGLKNEEASLGSIQPQTPQQTPPHLLQYQLQQLENLHKQELQRLQLLQQEHQHRLQQLQYQQMNLGQHPQHQHQLQQLQQQQQQQQQQFLQQQQQQQFLQQQIQLQQQRQSLALVQPQFFVSSFRPTQFTPQTPYPCDSPPTYSYQTSTAYEEPAPVYTNLNASCFDGHSQSSNLHAISIDISGNLTDAQYNKIFKKYHHQLHRETHPLMTEEDLEDIQVNGRIYFLKNVKTIVPKIGPWKFHAHISHRRSDERQYNIPGKPITCKVKEWLTDDGLWRLYHYKKGKIVKSRKA